MMKDEDHETQDFLERATELLRDVPVPDSPPLLIVVSTIEALHALAIPPDNVQLSERRQFMFRVARFTGFAAAVVLLAVAAVWFSLIDRSAGTLFAEAVENVKEAKSVSYSHRGKVGNKPLASFREYISGDHIRFQYEGLGSNVVDLGQKKGLILEPKRTLAFEYTIDEKTATELRNGMSQLLKLLVSKDSRQVGTETVKGREVVAYQVTVQETADGLWAYPGAINTILVDPKTKLPVRVEIKWPNGDFILYDDITWNERFTPDLFQFHVPKGYNVKTAEERLKEENRARGARALPGSSRDGGNKTH
jgi:outer membrane lipoprotein-sorting protein